MANSTERVTQPGNIGESIEQLKKLSIEQQKLNKDQQGNVDLLKESAKYLKGMSDQYDKINNRANSYNQSTINTKKLQSDLEKLTEKQTAAENNLVKVSEKYAGLESEFLKKLEEENTIQKKLSSGTLTIKQRKVEQLKLEELLKDEQVAIYKSALIGLKTAQDHVESGKDRLDSEIQIANKVGFTGNLLKQTNRYLGIGGDLYGKMVQEAREGESTIKKSVIAAAAFGGALVMAGKGGEKTLSATSGAMSSLTDSNAIQKMTGGISGMLKNIPFVGGLLGGLVDTMSSFLDLAIGASSKVQKMGRELGLSAAESQKLNKSFIDFTKSSDDALVNSQKLFETQIELGNQLGVLNRLSNDRLQTDIHLKDIAGLDLETRGSLVESSVILGKNQKDVMNSVFAQVEGLKQATGIQLNQKGILKEASNLGGYLGLSFAKYPAQLTKSLVSIKAMGLELKQLDGMASSFLDFESSISSEFEAQLLTGKDINLSKAREAFLNNDLAGAAQEITSQVGSSADFLKMNRIQAESLSKAFGMSRDQLGDMLKKQEYMSKIGAKDTDNAQKQYQLALAKYGTQEEMSEMLGKDTSNAIMNASAQEKIAGLMDKIKQGFVDLISNSKITGFIDKAIEFIGKPGSIEAIINKIQGFFSSVLKVTSSVVGGIMKFLNYIPGVNIDSSMIDMVENAGSALEGSSMSFGSTSVSANAAKGSANASQVAASSGVTKTGETNVNLKVEQMRDTNDPAKILYRVVNETTHTASDWQTGYIGM
jgi:hypothetical protein